MTIEEKITQKLKAFGVSDEFVKIALYYKDIYKDEIDINEFVEYVEEEFSKVEEKQFAKAQAAQNVDASALFGEFESEEDL